MNSVRSPWLMGQQQLLQRGEDSSAGEILLPVSQWLRNSLDGAVRHGENPLSPLTATQMGVSLLH